MRLFVEMRKAMPAGGDWQPIPHTIHPGGQRRRRGADWEYRYPDVSGGWRAEPPETARERRERLGITERQQVAMETVAQWPESGPPKKRQAEDDSATFWASLKPGDRFTLKQTERRFGEVHVFKVKEVGQGGELVATVVGGRTPIRMRLAEGKVSRHSGWNWGYPIDTPIPYQAPPPVTKLALPPAPADPHPLHGEARDLYHLAQGALGGVSGTKPTEILNQIAEAVHAAAKLSPLDTSHADRTQIHVSELGRGSHGVRARLWTAHGNLKDYMRQRQQASSLESRKEQIQQRASEEETIAKPPGTKTEDLPRPEPSPEVQASPEAKALYDHIAGRRVVNSFTIDDYPIGFQDRGKMKVSVDFKPAEGWRVVTQTTDKHGRWNKPKASTYSRRRVLVLEPRAGERGVLLSTSHDGNVWLGPARGGVEMKATGESIAKEIMHLAKQRWVAEDAGAVAKGWDTWLDSLFKTCMPPLVAAPPPAEPRLLLKGIEFPVGTIRQWGQRRYQKQAPARWRELGEARRGATAADVLETSSKAIHRLQQEIAALPGAVRAKMKRAWVDGSEFGLPHTTAGVYGHGTGEIDRFGKERYQWDAPRAKLHEAIMSKFFDSVKTPPADKQPVAVVMMGGGGSGKGTVKDQVIANVQDFVNIDADEVKVYLPEFKRATNLGTVSGKIITAMNGAAIVHFESSDVAHRLMKRSIAARKNVILDGTGKDGEAYAERVRSLREAGYHVTLLYVHLEMGEAINRAHTRADATGRYVQDPVLEHAHTSIPLNFEYVARHAHDFAMYYSERPPKKMWSGGNGKPDTIHDTKLVQDFRDLRIDLHRRTGKPILQAPTNKAAPGSNPAVSLAELHRRIVATPVRRLVTEQFLLDAPLHTNGLGGMVEVDPDYYNETMQYIGGRKVDVVHGVRR
jgi:predicted ABC-type ATPase